MPGKSSAFSRAQSMANSIVDLEALPLEKIDRFDAIGTDMILHHHPVNTRSFHAFTAPCSHAQPGAACSIPMFVSRFHFIVLRKRNDVCRNRRHSSRESLSAGRSRGLVRTRWTNFRYSDCSRRNKDGRGGAKLRRRLKNIYLSCQTANVALKDGRDRRFRSRPCFQ